MLISKYHYPKIKIKQLSLDNIVENTILQVQEENVRTLQDHDHELATLETERDEMISSFREKESKLLEEVENVRESSFVEMENTVSEMATQREMFEDLSQKYDQVLFMKFY